MSVPLSHVLIVASLMFAMGLGCVVAWRANVIMMLIGIEIMLNAVMLTFVGGSAHWQIADGQLFSLMLMALTSAEVSLALAMVVYLHRRKNTVNTDRFDSMKG
ncbi:NADH-quinone oxidoreductase subunit NuoK [Geomonas oryzisoli]|uniref:NADH-quinone oxidoreductase subunit K n=1 Tax=Geomonas oryzisoli TaxID=2847992 RepID=A0ABX8JA15_9BACT|nr:NADH-quinone oxidoreductase subunit NuoK [Geomonas oryzisoli]QWV93504.1 NADH-quinone oxidoreductase subunit NuoK [Geomonas oryzisoli]